MFRNKIRPLPPKRFSPRSACPALEFQRPSPRCETDFSFWTFHSFPMPKNAKTVEAGSLNRDQRRQLLEIMLTSRLGDLREQSLLRQGQGWFQVAGMGHEAVAALGLHLTEEDYLVPYYRDRALVLGKGQTNYDIALNFFAKRDSSSGGRQLPGHFSSRKHLIWSHPSPVGAHFLPACGIAWGMQLDRTKQVVLVSAGEAAARQGDFFEAICVAKEMKLPVVFVIEDNGIAISTPNRKNNPLALEAVNAADWVKVDGTSIEDVYSAGGEAIARARTGGGPGFLWLDLERVASHSSADDHRLYRCERDLDQVQRKDPLVRLKRELLEQSFLTEEEYQEVEEEIRKSVRADYVRAKSAEDPRRGETTLHVFASESARSVPPPPIELPKKCRMIDATNRSLLAMLKEKPETVFYGQDIEDPKGGVFKLSAGLSSLDPERVRNAPVAESTILGLACGLASYGKRPVFEIQFIDFIVPGWNQLVSNLATLRWRSFGEWSCPTVIYAPYGAYLPGGAIWHSQAMESLFAHVPGLKVVIPSTPRDLAGLAWSALHDDDPVLFLIPKHRMWLDFEDAAPVESVPLGKARVLQKGNGLTLVTWGNCVEIAEEAIAADQSPEEVELIDLRTIVPWDRKTIIDSVRKTGRLLVLHEDNESCSIGQAILSEISKHPDVWNRLQAPPSLVARQDTQIGFNPNYEYGALPDVETVTAKISELLGATRHFETQAVEKRAAAPAKPVVPELPPIEPSADEVIPVPILGEGIATARITSLLVEAGSEVTADQAICELETDKAVIPMEVAADGVLVEWKVAVGDEVKVGQPVAIFASADQVPANRPAQPIDYSGDEWENIRQQQAYAADNGDIAKTSGLSAEIIHQMQGIVPATISMQAKWEGIRRVRAELKKSEPQQAPSPSTMIAWAVVQAMKEHPSFTHTLLMGKLPRPIGDFDLGVAVSLPGDELTTAVLHDANKLPWKSFLQGYVDAIHQARYGRSPSKIRVPLLLSTMGTSEVRQAIPIVVPPSISTLFVGAAHFEPDPETKGESVREVASLTLTFDHRWINGAGAASFLSLVKRHLEGFRIPRD